MICLGYDLNGMNCLGYEMKAARQLDWRIDSFDLSWLIQLYTNLLFNVITVYHNRDVDTYII